MIKKIATKDLQIGMYVADVGRGWLNHPWATKSKRIAEYSDIARLLEYGITEVDVDLAKSSVKPLDNAAGTQPDLPAASGGTAEMRPEPRVAARTMADPAKVVPKASAQASPSPITAMELELPRASKAYNKALDASKALVAACRMNKKIELEAVRENVDELVESLSRSRGALMALIKLRRFDDYTYTHSLNVSVLAISVGKSLGLSDQDLNTLGLGTMFHDLGKSRVPGWILNKPGKLSDSEFAIMREHAVLSGRIIMEQNLQVGGELIYQIARHHHERIDGSGYPDHLEGDAIPGLVTVCGLSDVYDALTSDRVYHKGRSPHDALKFIYGLRGSHFQAEWVDRFVQSVGIYPPGTVVQLNTNQVAVVMDITEHLNEPIIKVVADPAGVLYARPKVYDLTTQRELSSGLRIKKVVPRDESGLEPASYFNPPRS